MNSAVLANPQFDGGDRSRPLPAYQASASRLTMSWPSRRAGPETKSADVTMAFLQKILPSQGTCVIAVPGPRGGFVHHPTDSPSHAGHKAHFIDQHGTTVYHACASYLYETPTATGSEHPTEVPPLRRTQDNVAWLRSFWLDLDVSAADPAKYQTQEHARRALADFVAQTGLPKPMEVSSGHGVHCYWPLTQNIDPRQWRAVAFALKALTVACGFKADPARTTDCASLLRPVGTHNRKGEVARPIVLLSDAVPIEFETMQRLVHSACRARGIDAAVQAPERQGATTPRAASTASSDAHLIAAGCNQIARMRDTRGNIPEPDWHAVIGVLDKTVQGEQLIHEWSSGHPHYSPEETQQKIARSKDYGPTTCQVLEQRNPDGCKGCPHKGKIRSPIQLGSPQMPQPGQAEDTGTLAGNGADEREWLNRNYAWIEKQKRIFRFKFGDFIELAEFRNAIANRPPVFVQSSAKPVPLAEAWLRWHKRRQHRAVVYEPGEGEIADDCVNLWRGWGCVPAAGDVEPWNQLLSYIFRGDEPARTFFERWVAYQIQHPGKKLHSAVVLWSSRQGVGKTLLGETVGRLFGDNFVVISAADLHGSFNSWAKAKQFVLGEENASGDQRADANRLKHLITGETVQLNEKFQPAYSLRNTLNFLFTSNHPDAFHLDLDDRRFFVWEILGERLDDGFYGDFVAWRDQRRGLQALMHHLQTLPLGDFDPKAEAPITQAKEEMVDLSRSELERWLLEQLDDGASGSWSPAEVATQEEIAQAYLRENCHHTTTTAVGKALGRLGRREHRRVTVQGRRRSLVAIRRVSHWRAMDNEAWAAEYEKQVTLRERPAASLSG